jgi:hypothetical protein
MTVLVVDVRAVGGLLDLLVGDVGPVEADVVGDRSPDQLG